MQISKYAFIILGLLVFGWCAAQPEIDFSKLETSVENNDQNKVALHYNKISRQISADFSKSSDFEQFLNFSRQLSRLGYADVVSSNLESIAESSRIIYRFSPSQKSRFLNEYGYACYYNNQREKSDSVFRQILVMGEQFEEIPELNIAFALNFLGLIYREDDPELAIYFFEKAKKIRIAELGENSAQVAGIYNNIGLAYKSRGDYEPALMNFKKAVEIKLISGTNSVYLNYINLGELSYKLGNNKAAIGYFKKAEKIAAELDIPEKQADIYLNLGGALITQNAFSEAYEYSLRALNIYTSEGALA